MCQLFPVDDKLTLDFCLDFFSEIAPTHVVRFSQISRWYVLPKSYC